MGIYGHIDIRDGGTVGVPRHYNIKGALTRLGMLLVYSEVHVVTGFMGVKQTKAGETFQ